MSRRKFERKLSRKGGNLENTKNKEFTARSLGSRTTAFEEHPDESGFEDRCAQGQMTKILMPNVKIPVPKTKF
jgi:hypothetical protein